jgi:hypothetical protein
LVLIWCKIPRMYEIWFALLRDEWIYLVVSKSVYMMTWSEF